ncbi:hypothetical protein HED63_26690 [Ochrobactrum cytisi]|nr:hypothetical protein [Brucella cytisi]
MAAILFYPPFWVAAGEAATAAAPWVLGALGVGVTAKVITDNMSTAEDKAQAIDQSGTAADTCVTGNCPPPNGGCKFDNYNKLDCEGGQKKHHIIADYVIRAGKRLDANMRLPNAPSLNDGPSICLSDTEHSSVHRQMDAAVANLGPEATLGRVKDIAMKAIENVKPECKSKMDDIKSKINNAFEKMGDDAPVRHQKSPLPKGDLLDRLFGRGIDSGLR